MLPLNWVMRWLIAFGNAIKAAAVLLRNIGEVLAPLAVLLGSIGAGFAAYAAFGALHASQQAAIEAHLQAVEAHLQTVAAEKNLPRSWLYVEVPKLPEKPLTPSRTSLGQISVVFSASIHNYGQVPAEILDTEAKLYAQPSGEGGFTVPFDDTGKLREGVVERNLHDWSIKTQYSTISPNGDLGPLTTTPVSFPISETYSRHFSPPMWLKIVIYYSDPYGDTRKTGYLFYIDGNNYASLINGKNYNYHE